MIIFDSFSKILNSGMECASNESCRRKDINNFPVKLVEPSSGRIVEFQVTEKDNFVADIYIMRLTTYAKCIEQYDVQWTVIGKIVRFTFPDSDMAENLRKIWKKRFV